MDNSSLESSKDMLLTKANLVNLSTDSALNQHLDENVSNFIVEAEPMEFEMDQMLGNNFIAYLSTDQNPKELFEA